jgi:hypothetical protein
VQFCSYSLESIFDLIDEALGDVARIEASAGEPALKLKGGRRL